MTKKLYTIVSFIMVLAFALSACTPAAAPAAPALPLHLPLQSKLKFSPGGLARVKLMVWPRWLKSSMPNILISHSSMLP